MAIIRAPRPDTNFYILDKKISEDKRLSWAARGLLIYLLGKPNHWTVSPAALVNETKDSAKASGRDFVYGLLKELLSTGYLRRIQNKKAGQFDSVDYVVSETPEAPPAIENPPLTELPEAVEAETAPAPHTDLPHTDSPHTANPTLVSTDSKKGLTSSEDLFGSGDASASPATPANETGKRKAAKKRDPAPSAAAWDAYSSAYTKRYSVAPLRTAKVNASLKTIVDSVGAEHAPALVTHYVTLAGYYADRQHDIGVLVGDLQKVWNSLNKANVPMNYKRAVTTADFHEKDYRKGVRADGSF